MKVGIITDIHIRSIESYKKDISATLEKKGDLTENDNAKIEALNHLKQQHKDFENFIIDFDKDALIISGDISSNNVFEDLEEAFKLIRLNRPKLKVFCVFGNHDFWQNKSFGNLEEILEFQSKMCLKYNIVHLENNYYEDDNIILCGYNGWYANDPRDMTKDNRMIPRLNQHGGSSFQALKKIEYQAIDNIIEKIKNTNKKVICVTHFNFFATEKKYKPLCASVNLLDVLIENGVNCVIYGHSHQSEEYIYKNCLMVNAGAKYEQSPSKKVSYKELDLYSIDDEVIEKSMYTVVNPDSNYFGHIGLFLDSNFFIWLDDKKFKKISIEEEFLKEIDVEKFKLIPEGPYCYSLTGNIKPNTCKYYSRSKDEDNEKEEYVSYCSFLDINSEKEDFFLLQDQCKECSFSSRTPKDALSDIKNFIKKTNFLKNMK